MFSVLFVFVKVFPIQSRLNVSLNTFGIYNVNSKKKEKKKKKHTYLKNNSWKPYVYIVITTGRPLCHEVLPER
jgi:hypothetical protein